MNLNFNRFEFCCHFYRRYNVHLHFQVKYWGGGAFCNMKTPCIWLKSETDALHTIEPEVARRSPFQERVIFGDLSANVYYSIQGSEVPFIYFCSVFVWEFNDFKMHCIFNAIYIKGLSTIYHSELSVYMWPRS